MAGWQPIRMQHLGSLPLIAQSAVEKTATLWSVINPEQFSNSWSDIRYKKYTPAPKAFEAQQNVGQL